MSDIYLQITETPTVVTLSAPVVASVMVNTVTVANVVSVNVVTMPAITVQAAAPSVTTVVGTVTANVPYFANCIEAVDEAVDELVVAVHVKNFDGDVFGSTPFPISGTVTANVNFASATATPPSNAVNIGFQNGDGEFLQVGDQYPLPVSSYDQKLVPCNNGNSGSDIGYSVSNIRIVGGFVSTSVTVPSHNIFKAILLDTSGRTVVTGSVSVLGTPSVTMGAISGTVTANLTSVPTHAVTLASTTVTVSSLPALAAGTAQIGSVTASISGTVTVSSTTVTVSALPSGALTTRFGSVTTANTSQITTAVTNTSRKYLLAQNISTGTVTIGIGFSPTTTQGIQLTAGAGLTFDSFVPTGAVYWLGATTGAAYTILEG